MGVIFHAGQAERLFGESMKIIVQNRKARHDYYIEESLEAGIVLLGSEVKSIREGRANIAQAYVVESAGELFLQGVHISPYSRAAFPHEPLRRKKLLLKKRQILKLFHNIQKKKMTAVPLCFYLNDKGWIKAQIGLARGKEKEDKRQAIKEREWAVEKQRLFKKTFQ
jgi:SsrA-binding protein